MCIRDRSVVITVINILMVRTILNVCIIRSKIKCDAELLRYVHGCWWSRQFDDFWSLKLILSLASVFVKKGEFDLDNNQLRCLQSACTHIHRVLWCDFNLFCLTAIYLMSTQFMRINHAHCCIVLTPLPWLQRSIVRFDHIWRKIFSSAQQWFSLSYPGPSEI